MSDADRYLWGTTKANRVRLMDFIDLEAQASAPDPYPGRLYRDSTGQLQLCEDGTNYVEVQTA